MKNDALNPSGDFVGDGRFPQRKQGPRNLVAAVLPSRWEFGVVAFVDLFKAPWGVVFSMKSEAESVGEGFDSPKRRVEMNSRRLRGRKVHEAVFVLGKKRGARRVAAIVPPH